MKKIITSLIVLILFTSLVTACTGTSDVTGNTETTGTISVVGSTSVTPLAQEIAYEFEDAHPEIRVDIQGVGSSAGIKAVYDGVAHIGMASRNLKPEEKEWGLTEHVIAIDGVAVAVHPNNPVSDLSLETVTKIFKGEITNWSEVGGNDMEILVVSREAGSGTRGAFEELVDLLEDKESLLREDALIAEGNGSVKANIASKEGAIGYLSLGYLDETITPVKIDGVEPTVENILSGDYKVSRPFLMLTKDPVDPNVQSYLDFIMSTEGQEIAGQNFVPVK